ncbi:MAG: hypothetical protein A2Z05_05710 [Chloroflexi bacterium RBG_16_60_22]|nr:MAG: hypothetical protein A2Z05_05710 [Chloroflexi bacterium RBG_16_60_22]
MRKYLLATLALILIAGLVLGGCAQTAPAPAPAPTRISPTPGPQGPQTITAQTPGPTATQKPAAPAKVYNLKFNDWGPAQIIIGQREQEWAKLIEERTNGRVKTTIYFAQSLAKYADTYRAVESGIADFSIYVIGVTQGIHELNRIVDLPFIGLPGTEAGTEIYNALRAKFPELDKEYVGTKVLYMRAMPPDRIHSAKKPIRIPADIGGKKVIAGARYSGMLGSLGAAQIVLGPPDWYMALDRGLAEAHITHWNASYSFNTIELEKYHNELTAAGAGMGFIGMLANLDLWNSLPADIQGIIMGTMKDFSDTGLKDDYGQTELGRAKARELGNQIIDISPEEYQQWVYLAKPTHQEWIADMKAKGLPGQAVYDETMRLIQQYK